MDQLRWFDHWLKGIDTGILNEPPVKLEIRTGGSPERYAFRSENEWPLARTQWTKMYLQIDREPTGDVMGVEGALVDAPPKKAAKITYSASGSTKAGVASGSSLATTHGNTGRPGVSFVTAPLAAGHRSDGAARDEPVGVEHVGRHGHLRHAAQHRPRRQGRVRSRPARPAGAVRHQGLAARIAPQARSGAVTAVPAVSRAQRTVVAEARTRSSSARSKCGRRRWCSRRAIASASTCSRATASAARPTRTITAITTRAPRTRSIRRRRQAVVPRAAGHSGLTPDAKRRVTSAHSNGRERRSMRGTSRYLNFSTAAAHAGQSARAALRNHDGGSRLAAVFLDFLDGALDAFLRRRFVLLDRIVEGWRHGSRKSPGSRPSASISALRRRKAACGPHPASRRF